MAEHGYATFIAISGPSRRWTTRLTTCGEPRTWRLGRFAPPSPSRPRSARVNRRCSLDGSTGLPALRAPSRAAHVDLREMRLGSGAGHAPGDSPGLAAVAKATGLSSGSLT